MTNNARNNKSDNPCNNNPDLRQAKEAINTINTCVIHILKQDIMSYFDDEVWDDLSLKCEVIGETIFTDDGWNFSWRSLILLMWTTIMTD